MNGLSFRFVILEVDVTVDRFDISYVNEERFITT